MPAAEPIFGGAFAREPAVGEILEGRFELEAPLARSDQALIFRARDRRTGAKVAVKLPVRTAAGDPADPEQFEREASIGASLHHPGILRFIEGVEKGRPYLVTEFVEGETLRAVLDRTGALPEGQAARIAGELCAALDYLHRQGIDHRDLKPENIMLCPDGSCRLIDFGLARRAERDWPDQAAAAMGTPDYIAPERALGQCGDHRSDLYSLGAVLYHLVTGVPPFEGESAFVIINARLIGDAPYARRRQPGLSRAMAEIIARAMAYEPRRRFASALELKAALDHPAVTLRQTLARCCRPSRFWAAQVGRIGLGVSGLIAVGGAVGLVSIFLLHLHS